MTRDFYELKKHIFANLITRLRQATRYSALSSNNARCNTLFNLHTVKYVLINWKGNLLIVLVNHLGYGRVRA